MASKTKQTSKASTKSTAVAVKENAGLPAGFEAYAGYATGFENDTIDDYSIPFFGILQGLSPQMQTVEGAKLGYVINNSTDELYPDGINMVVTHKIHSFVEWQPNRGGWVATYSPDSDVVADAIRRAGGDKIARLTTKAGNDLLDTKYIRGVLCDDDKNPIGFGTIAFTITKLKRYTNWNSDARAKQVLFQVPLAAIVWHFGTTKERNSKGEFFNWNHKLLGGHKDKALVNPRKDKALFDAVAALAAKKEINIDHSAARDEAGNGDAM